jgi:GNAT superfamily N-acetyltransferase
MSPRDSGGFEIEINPPEIAGEYLSCLNRSFHGWGGPETFRWAFERRVGGPPADLMALRLDGRLVAGSAVSYRRVALARGTTIEAGIMTGSWTLPEARGRGAFTRVIEESLRLASRRAAGLLLAFVTEENPSARRLAAAGSAGFPTFYLFSTADTPVPSSSVDPRPVEDVDGILGRLVTARSQVQAGSCHFVYPDAPVWGSQFLHRPGTIEVLSFDGTAWAVLERVASTDRIQLLVVDPRGDLSVSDCIAALLRRALDRDRQVFLFSTLPGVHDECRRLGLSLKPGLLTALVADESRLHEALDHPGPPASEGASDLADRRGPWFLGDWDLQSGDRA